MPKVINYKPVFVIIAIVKHPCPSQSPILAIIDHPSAVLTITHDHPWSPTIIAMIDQPSPSQLLIIAMIDHP